MYHNSATPPLPACYDDTCQPHPHLNMLSRTAEYIDVYRYIDIDVYRWSPCQCFPYAGPHIDYSHIDGPHTIQYRIVAVSIDR
jgi:hypothetical protein